MWLGQEVTSEMVVSPVYRRVFTGLFHQPPCNLYRFKQTSVEREKNVQICGGLADFSWRTVVALWALPPHSQEVPGLNPLGGRALSVRLPPTVQWSISPAMSWRPASSASGMVGRILVLESCPVPGLSGCEEAWCEWLCVPVQRPKTTTLVCICKVEHPCKGRSCMQSGWDLQMSELSTLDLLFVLNMEVLVNIIFCWQRAACRCP